MFVLNRILCLSVLVFAGCSSPSADGTNAEPSPDRPNGETAIAERPVEPQADSGAVRIVLLGDSITAGLGVDPDQAYPALLQARIDSLGWDATIVDGGVSGDTSTGGANRIDWLLQDGIDILVIELGGNDGLRGIDVGLTRENLGTIIEKTRAAEPDSRIILAGMMVPPNLGHEYTEEFRQMYPELAERYDVALIPFVLEGVGGVDSMMQADGIHPNAPGHRRTAVNVWKVLRPILEEKAGGSA